MRMRVRVTGRAGIRMGFSAAVDAEGGFVTCSPCFTVGDEVSVDVMLGPRTPSGIRLRATVAEVSQPSQPFDDAGGVRVTWLEVMARDSALAVEHFLEQVLLVPRPRVRADGGPPWPFRHSFTATPSAAKGGDAPSSRPFGRRVGAIAHAEAVAPVAPRPSRPRADAASPSPEDAAAESGQSSRFVRRPAGSTARRMRMRRDEVEESPPQPEAPPERTVFSAGGSTDLDEPIDGESSAAPAEEAPTAVGGAPVAPGADVGSEPDPPAEVDEVDEPVSSASEPAAEEDLVGDVAATGDEGDAEGVVVEPEPEVEIVPPPPYHGEERRDRPRVVLSVPVTFFVASAPLLGRARDASRSGIFVETEHPLPEVEGRVSIRLPVRFGGKYHVVMLTTRVIRHKADDEKPGTRQGFAAHFVLVDEKVPGIFRYFLKAHGGEDG